MIDMVVHRTICARRWRGSPVADQSPAVETALKPAAEHHSGRDHRPGCGYGAGSPTRERARGRPARRSAK
jgi:hypothetical protein